MPELFSNFCVDFNKKFQNVYDTKFILNSSSILLNQVETKSDLSSAYKSLKKISEIKFTENEGINHEIKAHDALSDSIMIGNVFIKSLHNLSRFKKVLKLKDHIFL